MTHTPESALSRRLLPAFGVTIGLIGCTIAQADLTYETRVLSGVSAINPTSDVNFKGFKFPVINEAGKIAFIASITGNEVNGSNDTGIWSHSAGLDGTVDLLAREGNPAPGTNQGESFDHFPFTVAAQTFNYGVPRLNAMGQTAFRARLSGTNVNSYNETGIWSDAAGSSIGNHSLIAREGDNAHDVGPDVRYYSIYGFAFNDAGEAAFAADLFGESINQRNRQGIWSEGGESIGSPKLVVRTSDAAPGAAPDATFRFVYSPVLNASGETAFRATLTDPSVSYTSHRSIWTEATDAAHRLRLVAQGDDPAPGSGEDVVFDRFGFTTNPVINALGQTAFLAGLSGPEVSWEQQNNGGIWSEGAGSIGNPALVARKGDLAPGTEPGVLFSNFDYLLARGPVINGAGEVAFAAQLAGSSVDDGNDTGIWSESVGSLGSPGLVVREGDAAPGTANGVYFGGFLTTPAINLAGQLAFSVGLTGVGVDETNDAGIWATDIDGAPALIVRKGDLFDVDSDPDHEDLRVVESFNSVLRASGNEDGQHSGFNDKGQLVFALNFTDGTSGIFVANTLSALSGMTGDYDESGLVEQGDLNLVLNNWGSQRTFNDGTTTFATNNVDQEELNAVLNNWGASAAPSFAGFESVPEPALAGVVVAAVGMFAPRHRRR
ncbi:MAG: choice-of-anchor tandem repeat NxxGxxAF-containing protein [Planctomycetota bacterium]